MSAPENSAASGDQFTTNGGGLHLQPCPFCGGPVEMIDPEAWTRGVVYGIQCDTCYVSMNAWKLRYGSIEGPESLASRWNHSSSPRLE